MIDGGAVVWFTGLPASGKSVLARALERQLRDQGRAVVVLDGDEVRDVLVPHPGHDADARDAFYRTLGGLAALLAGQGLVVLVAATAHRRVWRELARARVARFVEVYVATQVEECRRRDPKGLYRQATELPHLPGVGVPYEPPEHPDVISEHGGEDERAIQAALGLLLARN